MYAECIYIKQNMDANSNKDEFYPISVAETELQESVMLQT